MNNVMAHDVIIGVRIEPAALLYASTSEDVDIFDDEESWETDTCLIDESSRDDWLHFPSASRDQQDFAIVGAIVGSDPESQVEANPLPDIDEIKEEVKRILRPAGLWNEEAFGLWSMIYHEE